MTCKATRVNDQMICGACGLQWDHDDPEPPTCRTEARTVYVLHPGWIRRHWISAPRLAKLYGVAPTDCIEAKAGGRYDDPRLRFIHLHPSPSGRYELPDDPDPLAEARKVLKD